MALDPDPYRILELPRGASLDDVKRAYRRLAKAHHPDAAGEAALPRFLAIQAAYEQLLTGSDVARRGRGPASPRRAWEADPQRSEATRRAYGGRARSGPAGARGATPGNAGAGQAGDAAGGGSAGTAGAAGPASAKGPAGPGGAARPRGRPAGEASGSRPGRAGRRRTSEPGTPPGQGTPPGPGSGRSGKAKRNKATLGSTSYDGAADGPFEPDWRGASWYGTTSGTYWTLNPKEYADPRKHGPEYQARARRSTRARTSEVGATEAAAGDATTDPAAEPVGDHGAGPTHTTSSWWDSTAGPAAGTPGDGASAYDGRTPGPPSDRGDPPRPATVAPPSPDLGRAMADITHALTDERFGGIRGRVARAVIGWLPIAFGIGWLAGEMTGCGRFAATCDGSTAPIVVLLQLAALAILLVLPILASIATMAALTLVATAVVAALILSATGSAADVDARQSALGAILLVAWLVGVAGAVARRLRAVPPPPRPVS